MIGVVGNESVVMTGVVVTRVVVARVVVARMVVARMVVARMVVARVVVADGRAGMPVTMVMVCVQRVRWPTRRQVLRPEHLTEEIGHACETGVPA